MQSSQPLQYVSLTWIQPLAGIGTPYLSSRMLISSFTAYSLSLFHLLENSAKRHFSRVQTSCVYIDGLIGACPDHHSNIS
jgi:hypothetical protein